MSTGIAFAMTTGWQMEAKSSNIGCQKLKSVISYEFHNSLGDQSLINIFSLDKKLKIQFIFP